MAHVVFPEQWLPHTQGEREADVVAANYRELTQALRQRWPEIDDLLERSAVAINGQIYQDAFLEPLEPNSEVFFMARIEGG